MQVAKKIDRSPKPGHFQEILVLRLTNPRLMYCMYIYFVDNVTLINTILVLLNLLQCVLRKRPSNEFASDIPTGNNNVQTDES